MDSIDKLLILPVFKASTTAVLVPAVREGWRLVVAEGNALGTPAIGYDVLGLRDSIRYGMMKLGLMLLKNHLMRWHSSQFRCLEIQSIFPIIAEMHFNMQGNLARLRLRNHFRISRQSE
jgi:glycosyltransferase involved in cell wall biosynthesis